MPTYLDKTLKDTIRRALNVREQQVDSLLPAVVLQEYPKFVTFLKKYFELQEQDGSLNRFLNNVFETRDVTQTDRDLLQYFEDSLHFHLVFEKLEGGPLLSLIQSRNYFSEFEASLIIRDLSR